MCFRWNKKYLVHYLNRQVVYNNTISATCGFQFGNKLEVVIASVRK